MRRLLREPLVHFVLLGAMLFGAQALLGGSVEASDREIVIAEGDIESMVALFLKTWQRPPSAEELQGLIDDRVIEQMLYREALALGLDRDDTIVRRRMRQKMEFLVADLVEQAAPDEDELAEWLRANPGDYTVGDRYDFRQVFVNSSRRGESA